MRCSNQRPLALRATAVNAATKQPRHKVRVSAWLSETELRNHDDQAECLATRCIASCRETAAPRAAVPGRVQENELQREANQAST